MSRILTIIVLILIAWQHTNGQTTTTTDGVWSNDSNWSNNSPGNSTSQDSHVLHSMTTTGPSHANDTIVIDTTGILTLNAGRPMIIKSGGVVIIYGQLICTETYTKVMSGGTLIIKGGGEYLDQGEGDPEVGDGGRLRLEDGAFLTIEGGGDLTMYGEADVVNLSSNVVIDGAVSMPSAGGTFTNSGTIAGDGAIEVSGTYENTGTVTLTTNGSLVSGNFSTAATWSNTSVPSDTSVANVNTNHIVTLDSSFLVTALVLDSAATFNLSNDTISISDNLSIHANATLNTQTGAIKFVGDSVVCVSPITYFDLIIAVTDTSILCGDLTIDNNFTQESTTTLDLGASSTSITIKGDVNLAGNVIHRDGTMVLSGTSAQTIAITDTVEIGNLTINNSNGVAINSGYLKVNGSINVINGTLNTNNRLILSSNATGTGSIADLSSGTVTGDVQVERHLSTPGNSWKMFGAPTSKFTFADIDGEITTTGITGSDYPNYNFNSIYFYDETATGSAAYGYEVPDSMNQTLVPGMGYMAYVSVPSQGLTVNHTGPINQGDFSFPVTYTDDPAQSADQDGWNFIANPYPATLDWDAADWVKTNVNNAVYVWNESAGQYATYIAGVGANGGSKDIPSGQGFWIQTNGASPVLTAKETCKATTDPGFYKTVAATPEFISIKASNSTGSDELVINIRPDGSPLFNQDIDAKDLGGGSAKIPNIYAQDADLNKYVIKSVHPDNLSNGVDFYIPAHSENELSLAFSNLSTIHGNSCTKLLDLNTGESITINNDTTLVFATPANGHHFVLTTAVVGSIELTTASNCISDPTVEVNYDLTGTNTDVGFWTITNGANETIDQFSTQGPQYGNITVNQSGTYTASFKSTSTCATSSATQSFEIRNGLTLIGEVIAPECADQQNGSISVTAVGGWGAHQYSWADGSSAAVRSNLTNGPYEVTVTDSKGCVTNEQFNVQSTSDVEANISFDSLETISTFENLNIQNASTGANQFEWTWSDNFSDRIAPNIHFEEAGSYIVELVASNGICTDHFEVTVEVENQMVTSIESNPSLDSPEILYRNGLLINNSSQAIQVNGFNMTGQLIVSMNIAPNQTSAIIVDQFENQPLIFTSNTGWSQKVVLQ